MEGDMKKLVKGVIGLVMVLLLMSGENVLGAGLVEVDFNNALFSDSLNINNPYWPLMAGTTFEYRAETEDGCIVNEVFVTSDVKTIVGIDARVIEDREWDDDNCDGGRDYLLEETFDWYAQDDAGNIWYMGEDTKEYCERDSAQSGQVCSTEGSWEAGMEGAEAGIIMLANPQPGDFYRQEYAEGEAEDMGKVLRINDSVSIDMGDYENCLKTKEWTLLEPGSVEHKHYCPGIGLVLVDELKEKTVHVELVEVTP